MSEYLQFFNLSMGDLRDRSVLDVAVGPSSFTAEACRAGIDVVAVDPLYGKSAEALAAHVKLDYGHMFDRMRATENSGRFRFKSIDEAERNRRAAARRFVTDYESHYAQGRYFGAGLPQLPFLDRNFDVVLCAHLLYLYPANHDYSFHFEACRKLICGWRGKKYGFTPCVVLMGDRSRN